MSKTVVFLGPTLSTRAAVERLGAADLDALQLRGPARCGDVWRAVEDGYTSIGLIDGYFDHSLSVWHKELLWALHRGCAVFGASSMGALRAAELHIFGMRGVGRIFEAFRDGLLNDDDEVAVVHADPTQDYRPQSEALVNIRVTLQLAVSEGVLCRSVAQRYVALARARFYPERHFAQLLSDAAEVPELAAKVSALRTWLGPKFERRVNQKAEDAIELLQILCRAEPPVALEADRPQFAFAYTEGFHELIRRQRRDSTE